MQPSQLLTPTAENEAYHNYTYIQCQIDLLRERIEESFKENVDFKNDINKRLQLKSMRDRDEVDILYEQITLLERENSCLKNEIKNQQYIIKMLANENNTSQWKTVNNRNGKNINRSTEPKSSMSFNLNNRFDTLNINENCEIELDDNTDVTPTRHTPNEKPKSRNHQGHNSKNQQLRRPQVDITEKYINTQREPPRVRARSLVASDLRSETKGSRLESGCQLCAEVSSLQ